MRLARGAEIIQDIDLHLAPGQILGIVGESGSGKTTTALSLLGFTSDGTQVASGSLELGGSQVRIDDNGRAPARIGHILRSGSWSSAESGAQSRRRDR